MSVSQVPHENSLPDILFHVLLCHLTLHLRDYLLLAEATYAILSALTQSASDYTNILGNLFIPCVQAIIVVNGVAMNALV